MKRICLFVSICILSLSSAAIAADEIKLGSVDMPKVVQESEAGKKAMAELKETADKLQSSMKSKEKELEKLKTALLDKGKTLTEAKRTAKEKEFQKKFEAYQQAGKNAQQEFAKKETDLSKPIKEDLEKLVKDYGLKNGYTVISHKEGIVYNNSKYEVKDLTDEIIKIFNGAAKK
jgi:outer membrane protein